MSVLARCSYNILYGVVVEVVEFFSLFGSKRVRKVEHKLLKGDHSENNQSSYHPPPPTIKKNVVPGTTRSTAHAQQRCSTNIFILQYVWCDW